MRLRLAALIVTLALGLLAPPFAAEAQHTQFEECWVPILPDRRLAGQDPRWWHYIEQGFFALEMRARAGQDAAKRQRYVADAEAAFRAAVKENERSGLENERLAYSLALLGGIYHLQHKFLDAESLYKRALAIYERTFGQEDQIVVLMLVNLGCLYQNQGRLQEAELLLKRAVAIQEKLSGPQSQRFAAILGVYANLLREMGRTAEARELDPEEAKSKAKADVQELSFAVLRYEAYTGALPETLEELTKPVTNREGKQMGPLLPRLPNPPKGYGAYRYERLGSGAARFRISTSGYGEVIEDRR